MPSFIPVQVMNTGSGGGVSYTHFSGPLSCFANEMAYTGAGGPPISQGRPMPTWGTGSKPEKHEHPEYAPRDHNHPHQHPEYNARLDELIRRLREGPTPNDGAEPATPGEPANPREPAYIDIMNNLMNTVQELSAYKGKSDAFGEILYKENIRHAAEDLFKYALDSKKPVEEILPMYKSAVEEVTKKMLANSAYRIAIDNGANPYEAFLDFLDIRPERGIDADNINIRKRGEKNER